MSAPTSRSIQILMASVLATGIVIVVLIIGFALFLSTELRGRNNEQSEIATLAKSLKDAEDRDTSLQKNIDELVNNSKVLRQDLNQLKIDFKQEVADIQERKHARDPLDEPDAERLRKKNERNITNEFGVTVKEIEARGEGLGRDVQMPCRFEEINNRWRGVLDIDESFVGFFVRDKKDELFELAFVKSDFYGQFLLDLENGTPVRLHGQIYADGGKNRFMVRKIELLK